MFCVYVLQISKSALDCFLLKLEAGYSKFGNPYHNLLHAADVTQTANVVLGQSGLLVRTANVTGCM